MSAKEVNAAATMASTMATTLTSSPTIVATAEDEEEPPTLSGSADMDLVNGPNPWLPAYGFQLQHHSHFQPTHEDLRTNDTVLVQQVDFLETILEETSDDLQSDSDRSGTTYWLGSDSETESVIHIRAKQRSVDERHDGSGSECNSVVPKKRRRRNNGTSDRDHQPAFEDYPGSPRSSRSSASSRASSLLQFESLERTCATLSPSSYSFDSLEYSNRSIASHHENTSPDSLEQDYEKVLPNGYTENTGDHFPRIRPYRSFESLEACQKDNDYEQDGLTNGFAPLYLKRNSDLSRPRRNHQCPRDFWHEDEEYEEDEDEEDLDDDDRPLNENRACTSIEDRLMVFGDSTCNYATSLDYRNTIDLREIGVETKRDTLLDLKSGQATVSSSLRLLQARLNITGNMAASRNNMVPDHHHHHHHHHHQQQQQQHQHHVYEHHEPRQHQQHQQGWSKEECFNFRFTDKSQSAPSLPSSFDESAHSPRSLAAHASSRATSFVSTSNLFENYTRVASVPIDLNLCGVSIIAQDDLMYSELSRYDHEMAEVTGVHEKRRLESVEEIQRNGEEEDEVERMKNSLMSSVRTQAPQSVLVDGKMERESVAENSRNEEESADEVFAKPREKKQVTSTVKTQDRGNCVLDMAIAMENDIDAVVDEAIKQFKREVEEGGNTAAALLALDGLQRTLSGKQRPRKVKNNASYELAQQYMVDERNLRPQRFQTCHEIPDEVEKKGSSSPRAASGGRKRVLNNASYELAQQCDYIKVLQSSRNSAFQRMDACDELEESMSGRHTRSKVTDQQMGGGSVSNLSTGHYNDPRPETRSYSKSTENVSTQFGQRSTREEDNSLLGQIKKNSDPFSIYGEDPSTYPLVDDEVDYPCLETKPIGASSLEGGVSREESNLPPIRESQEKSQKFESSLPEAFRSNAISEIAPETLDGSTTKGSFIGEFYPEKMVQPREPEGEDHAEVNATAKVTSDGRVVDEGPGTKCDGNAGERLWRVVVEKQAAEKEASVEKVTRKEEEKKEPSAMEKEATATAAAEAARGHSVHSVRAPPLGINSTGSSNSGGPLEPSQRSGNPAVAVAVDTNHRGVRDKRHEENAAVTATTTSTTTTTTTTRTTIPVAKAEDAPMSTTVKRPFVPPSSPKDTSASRFQRNVVVDASSMATTKEERKKGGLGGFLQRFSRLRFSGRSKVPRSELQKKSDTLVQVNRGKVSEEQTRKEPDYIIIPLHPPEEERRKNELLASEVKSAPVRRTSGGDVQRSVSNVSTNGRAPVSSKPPLPPQPPRVGALSSRPSTGASSASSSSRRRAATDLGNPAAIEMAKARTMQAAQERPVGLLETDLDEAVPSTTIIAAPVTGNAAGKKTRSLLNLNHTSTAPRPRTENALHVPQSPVGASHRSPRDDGNASTINQRPHKSMEFLLDKENLHFVKPPENELQKVGERVPSEHELRVQRSLQRLNVPDWYKNSPAARDGFRLKRHSDASQHGGWRALGSKTTSLSSLSSSSNRQPTAGALLSPSPTPPVFSRWSTSLLNSAGSSPASSAMSSFNHRQPYLGWRSQERLSNPRTPAERLAQGILPQLQATNKQQQQQQQTTNQQLEVRNSIKEVTSAIVHYVQSGQEVGGGGRLSPRPRPEDWDDRGGARSTSPRGSVKLCWMESSFVGTRPVDSPETPMSLATETDCCPGCNATGTESCSCIDSATSGLFLDLTPTRDDGQHQQQQLGGGSSSLCPSPSSSLNYHHQHHHQQQQQHHHHHRQLHHQQQQQQQQRHHRGSGQSDTDEAMATAALLRNKPSPGSTTLEDVLDSLLGLPSASRTPSPGPGPVVTGTSATMRHRTNAGQANAKAGKSCSDLRQDLQESARSVMDVQGATEERASYYVGELVRRKSEGSDAIPSRTSMQSRGGPPRHRRDSFENTQETNGLANAADKVIRCRNNKCTNWTTLAEARKIYKSCHNCTYLYCSRECRRTHWQRHRRTCLHYRAGSLCRQVLSSAKKDAATLKHISALAKRGYASHGRGAVKCFFSSPETAEKFIGNGFMYLSEPTYVRWSDLLASEMGAELYAEAIRLCKSYNPETRLVLYVAVCVVSEVPTSGAVKWERQLVSRCAKIHLDTVNRQHTSSSSASPQGRQQSMSPCNITREMESPETLVLTSLPENNGQNTPIKIREISFANIQRQLKLRGVSLRRHFPQVYRKLRDYVDGTVVKFAPVTIYPRDQASGKSFMCIIMLDVEPERLQLLPTDSSRVRTVDISVEQE